MTKKVLFAANLESFFTKFLIPQLEQFKKMGYEVHIAAKSEDKDIPFCDKKFDVDFARGFSIKQNLKSYKQMKKILEDNHYDIISCHTPFGAAITRLAAKNCKLKDTKIVYMCHGFHFYEGAPKLKFWLFYYGEKYLAKFTDTIITINLYDYEMAKKHFKCNIEYVPGVGLDSKKFEFKMTKKDKLELRKSLDIKENDFVMTYPAELLGRKRQIWLINTLKNLLYEHKDFHLLLPGKDSLNGKCEELINELNLNKQVHLLGFRNDIPALLKITNLAVTSSLQEGLPVNVMEAIYVGIPVVATDCRGNKDLIENNKNGYIVPINDSDMFCDKVLEVYKMTSSELNKIIKMDKIIIDKYLLNNVIDEIMKIYNK